MTEKKLVPKRRLEGFEDEWEEFILGDHATIKGRLGWKSLKREEYVESGPSMIAGRHIKNGVINWKEVDHIPLWRYEESPEIMLKNEDIIFSKDGSLGNPALITNLKGKVTINATMMLVRTKKNLDPSYFYQILNSKYFLNLIDLKVSGSSIPHLFQEDMKKFQFFAPKITEQQKIGDFFKRLDEMIALEQRKINKTKALKNAYLTEMFPAEGERVPRRRFEGFTDEWIPFKLKDLIVSEEKGNARADMLGHNSLYLDANFLNGGAPVYINSLTNVKEDDVLILWDGSHAGKVYHGFKGALGSTLKALKPLESGGFIYYFLYFNQKKIFEQYRTPNIPHVINTFTDEFMICKPSLEEQLKISGFFKKIDYIIETHKQKLEKLKAIKQAYLHEMFV